MSYHLVQNSFENLALILHGIKLLLTYVDILCIFNCSICYNSDIKPDDLYCTSLVRTTVYGRRVYEYHELYSNLKTFEMKKVGPSFLVLALTLFYVVIA